MAQNFFGFHIQHLPIRGLLAAILLLSNNIRHSAASSSTSSGDSLAQQRAALPTADWIPLVDERSNVTALAANAFHQAKQLGDEGKLTRIEQMMNTSQVHNDQILKSGAEALDRLTSDDEDSNSAKGSKITLAMITSSAFCIISSILLNLWL